MPKIGMRIIKTSVAVFLCFIIDMLRGEGIPFYSAIAAVLCMQRELEDSRAKGKSRMIATLIGGIAGMMMLYFMKLLSVEFNTGYHYALVSFALIPIIYITVLMKQPDCSYLSCVVFLCICISHGNDNNPFSFAVNRMLDTWIGILVALGVNAFHIPHHVRRNTVIELPLSYITEDDKISNYMLHHLNRFDKEGMQLIITSFKTPAQLNQCVPANLLVKDFLLLDAAIHYDRRKDICTAKCEMSYSLWKSLYTAFSASGFSAFLYEISDSRLYIHHQRTMNEQESLFYQSCLLNHENHFVLHDNDITEAYLNSCIMLELLFKKDQAAFIYQVIKPFTAKVTWISYYENNNEQRLRIYPIQTVRENQMIYECESNQLKHIRYKHKPNEKKLIADMRQIFYHS